MGDKDKAAVEVIRVCRLRFNSSFILDLDETLYIHRLLGEILFLFHC